MEGNDIEDLGGGSFRTTAAVQRYSRLDQYAMGLVSDESGAAVLLRRQSDERRRRPDGGVGAACRRHVQRHAPRRAHRGRHRDPRRARRRRRPIRRRVHRQAFIFVVGAGRSADNAQVAKLDRIRRAWETFFLQATEGRMQAVTTLRCSASDSAETPIAKCNPTAPMPASSRRVLHLLLAALEHAPRPDPRASPRRRRPTARAARARWPSIVRTARRDRAARPRRPSPRRSCPAPSCSSAAAIASSTRRRSAIARSCRRAEPMTLDTVFDLASLTKVVATTTSVMMLVEQGRIRLNDRVASYIPGFERYGKGDITIRHLLTHVSGLRPDVDLADAWIGYGSGDRAGRRRGADVAARRAVRLQRHQLLSARRHRAARQRHAARSIRARAHLRAAGDEATRRSTRRRRWPRASRRPRAARATAGPVRGRT